MRTLLSRFLATTHIPSRSRSLDTLTPQPARPRTRLLSSALELFSLSVLLFTTASSATAQTVIASDSGIGSLTANLTLDAGGSSGNNAQYIVGNSGAYNSFTDAGSVTLGSSNDYNEFIVRNGSEFNMANSKDIILGSDNNSVTVTGANSKILVHYHSSGVVSTGTGDSNNTVDVLNGGFFQMGDFNIGSNSTGNTMTVDGTDSVLQTRETINVASGGELSTTIANGGLVTVASFSASDNNLGMTINDGGTLLIRSAQDLNEFSTFTLNSGGILNAYNTLSNLADITSGQTVDLTRLVSSVNTTTGSFGTATTLDGGTLVTVDYDYSGSNLTFTSGTHEASGALSNTPDIEFGMTVDLTPGGSFATATTLDGGTAKVDDFNLATDNLTFTSGTLDTSGTLTVGSDNSTETLSGGISGTGGLTKSGTGTLTLSGTNTYSGATTVSAGTLSAGSADTLSPSSTVTLTDASDVVLDLNDHDQTIAGLAGGGSTGGDVDLGSARLTVDQSHATSFGGAIEGTGGITKSGSGTLTLSGDNNYSGGTTISDGTLVGTTSSLQGDILNNAELEFAQTTSTTFSDIISGSGSLTISGSGEVTLTGANTYSGGTTLTNGTLIGDTTSLQGDITHDGYSLEFAQSSDGAFSDNIFGSGALTKSGNGVLTLSGNNTYAGGTTVSAGTLLGDTDSLQGDIANNASLVFDQDSSGLFAGDVSGSGSLTKTGSGTVTLTGDNSYAGGTTVSAGTLQGDTDSLQGDINNNSAITFDQNANGSFTGNVSGNGTLTKSGTGILTLSGTNTYSGGTTVSNGTLVGTTSSLQGDITNNAALAFNQDTDGTFSDVISGSGSLAKSGTGTTTLTGTNTYSGGTTISAGTLAGTNINLGSDTVTLDGGTLSTTTYDATLLTPSNGTLAASGSLTNVPSIGSNFTVDLTPGGSFGNTITLDGGTVEVDDFNLATDNLTFTSGTLETSGTLTIGSDDSTQSLSGVISGTGSLTKSGSGSVTLTGDNTYSGGTTVSAGTLSLGSDSAAGTGTITTTGSVIEYADGVTIANAIDLHSDTTQLQVTSGSSATQSGVISETGGARPLEKIGAGTLALTGSNTYSGGTTIFAGTLSGTNANFGSGTVTIDGGTLDTSSFDGTSLTFTNGSLAASGSLTNLPTIAANNTVDISGGGSFGDATTLDGGTVQSGAFDYSTDNLTFISGTHQASGALTNLNTTGAGQSIVLDGSSATWSPNGDIDAGAVTLLDNAKLNVGDYDASNLTFTHGDLTVTGTLTGLDSLSSTNQDIILDGGTWAPSGNLELGSRPKLSDNITLKNGAILSIHDYEGEFASGGLTGADGGTLVVSGKLNSTRIGLIADPNLTIDLTPGGQLVGSLFGSGEAAPDIRSGHIITNDATLGTEAGDLYFEPDPAGASLTVKGTLSGTLRSEQFLSLVLDGGSHTTTSTNINTLASVELQNAGSLSVAAYDADNLTFTDGTLTATGSLTNLPTIAANNLVDISGGGSLGNATTLDGGELKVADFNLATDNLTFTSGTLDTSGTLTVGSDDGTQSLAGVISGTGSLTKSGSGTLTLSGNNTYSGGTTISAGTLSLGADTAAGSGIITTTGSVIDYADGVTVANAIDLQSDTTQLQVTSGSATQSGLISETGGSRPLEKIGDGTLILTGTNTYSGGTTISAGTLGGTTSSLQGDITNNGALVFDQSTDGTFTDNISGTGSLTKSGTGKVSLSGTNTYTGVTTISAGTLGVVDFDATNLTFTNGTLETSGALTNLNTLNANQTVDIDGGSWSPSGDIDAGNVILHNTGQLTVGDYNATNLVGVSGDNANPASTLTAIGTLTNVNHAANLNIDVVLDGGTWADSTLTNGLAITVKNGGSLTTPADYDASLLTFTNGTLNTSGALTNLNTLSAGNTLVLDGGSWSPSGSIDDGSLTLQNAAALTVGDYSAANLTFTNGSIETSGALTNLNTLNADQAITLNGASASWSPSGNIDSGDVTLTEGSLTLNTAFDAANFTFDTAHGGGPLIGTLTMNTGALTNLNTLPLSAGVVLDGDSSWAPTGDVSVGHVTLNHVNSSLSLNGNFDSRFITFNAGTLNTNGTISELNTLSASQAIVMDGGSWSPTGNIDAGSLTLQNAAALTIGDHDATNLTFTSGSITTDGALTNLNTLNANQAVTLNGSGASWSPSGNIDAGTVNLTEGSLTLNTSFDASNLNFASTSSAPVALLTMNFGALSNLNTLQVGQRVTLNGSSTWAPTGNIETGETVLNNANARLTTTGDLDTRAVVFNAGTLVGDGVLSELPTLGTNMTVDISNGGSLGTAITLDRGTLITGDFDAAPHTITRGDLTVSGVLSNLANIFDNLEVDLFHGGSLATASTLDGGELYVSDFDATHLSLSSGELIVSGEVSNLATIGENVFVGVDRDGGFSTNTTLDGGALFFEENGIVDFEEANLTFTAGTLGLYDTGLANLPDITTGQIVELFDSGFVTNTTLAGGQVTLVEDLYIYSELGLTFDSGTLVIDGAEIAELPAITANQTVDISNHGEFLTSTFLAGGTLVVDDLDLNGDNVQLAFGTLEVQGVIEGLEFISTGLTVDIGDEGRFDGEDDRPVITGGTLRGDDIDLEEDVRLESGTVEATGIVYFDDDIESGQTIDLTPGGEFHPGSDVTVDGGTLKVVDFNADGGVGFRTGTLSVTGELTNLAELEGPGELGLDGQIVILDGGTWAPGGGNESGDGDGPGDGPGDYINDGNITIQNDGLLIVNSNYDATNLTFTNGTLHIDEGAELENLNTLGAGQTVVLDNESEWVATGDINDGNIEIINDSYLTVVGDPATDTAFDATNLTFTFGDLTIVDQDLINLNTVGADRWVYLENASWAPTGSIDDAETIGLADGASLTVGDYNADNIEFESGTLTTTGELTNLNTLGANQAVVIDGGEWLPTGGNVSGGDITVENDGLFGVGTDFSTGTFDATNLTLTNGTLSTNHDITNLDTLGADATIELFADAEWSPTGDIEAGTVKLNGGTLNVGDYNATNLPLSFDGADAGGTLRTTGTLSNLDTLPTDLEVNLDGGIWSPTGDIDSGTVVIDSDGHLTVTDYDASNLTLTDGTLTTTGSLSNLNALSSSDQHVELDGGTWSPTGSVDAGNITLRNEGTLNVGDFDATRLTLTTGTVASDGSLTNLPTIAAGNTIDVTTSGTIDSATTLSGGTIEATELDATNITFTAGTIAMSGGELTNLNTLGTHQTVTLDNAEWSPTGDIDGGEITLDNDATLTVTDFDTANLTFTSGTVAATGTLTHDRQLAANQTVRLNGNGATYDVGINLQLEAGTIELSNGGTLNLSSHTATVLGSDTISFETGGGDIALNDGTLNLASLDGPFGLGTNGAITGNGSIFGDVSLGTGGMIDGDATGLEVFGHISGTGTVADTTIFGNVTVGNSPGDITLENTTLSASTIVSLAIEGTEIGEFDRLFVDANSDVSAASLEITFENYTPGSVALTFAVVSNNGGTQFASISTPEGWTFSNGSLSAVPEPGSFALLAGLLAIGFTTTRRRGRK